MSRTVLVDLTPLGTPTRVRGIGRYLRTLALGLSRLSSEETTGLKLLALTGLSLSGDARVSDDLGTAAGEVGPEAPTQGDRFRWAYARRLALWAAARRHGAALVHLGDPNSTPLGLSRVGCRRVMTCHDLIPFQFPEVYLGVRDGFGLIGKALIRRRFVGADGVLAISEATRQELMRLLGVPAARIMVAHNGIDLASFSAEPRADDRAYLEAQGLVDGRFALYVGDTDWRKNVEGMIAAIAGAGQRGLPVDLVFVGKLEPEKVESIRRVARERSVEQRLRFLGYVTDLHLQALYRAALAHLFVSRFEGFGYTVVEAMASGCPVITTRCGSLAEVAGDAGVLVDPDDHAAMSGALVRLAEDDAHRSGVIAGGLERARRFSCEEQARATIRVYRHALSG